MVLPSRLTSLGLQAGIRRRGDRHDEMGHIFDALLQMVVDLGELTGFVDLLINFPLIIVVDARMNLVGQWNGPRASERRRKWSSG